MNETINLAGAHAALLHQQNRYERHFANLCLRYHPAIAAVIAHDTLATYPHTIGRLVDLPGAA